MCTILNEDSVKEKDEGDQSIPEMDCETFFAQNFHNKAENVKEQKSEYLCCDVLAECDEKNSNEVIYQCDMSEASKLFLPPSPYYLPGYTGFCPQVRHRCGKTYGADTHNILVDKIIAHSKEMRLADTEYKPMKAEEDLVATRCERTLCVYKLPISTSYGGFMPRLQHFFGMTLANARNCSLADFEKIRHNKMLMDQKLLNAARKERPKPVITITPEMLDDIKSKLQ